MEKLREADPPTHWRDWLTALFPRDFDQPFAAHHAEFWRWVERIEPGVKPKAFFAIWPRGGAKSTAAEAAVVRVAAKATRRFCLYVRATQDKANESVQNIAAKLTSAGVARHYPQLAERKLSKYGFAKGWRVDMLQCASGFSVVALGFDAAVRGIKIEEARPDLIILDDVDEEKDSLKTTAKKMNTLTTSILPAGSTDVAVLGVQNLVHAGSIFNALVEDSADFLYNRVVSGPHPAVKGLEYEARPEGGFRITGGQATWAGQDLAVCEAQINEWGLTSFLREAQHDLEEDGGIWSHVEFRRCEWNQVPDIVRGAVWIDPAVTATDESDCFAMQADGLGVDDRLYRFYSWEGITTPEDALERAMLKCIELGFEAVGVETDQGGDVWRPAYNHVWDGLVKAGKVARGTRKPKFKQDKAGAGHGSKVARNQRMLVDYDRGMVVHVVGTHKVLERALKRFPKKPLDLADVAYWGWKDLLSRKPQKVANLGKHLAERRKRR